MKKVAILGIATVAMLALMISSQTVLCCVGPGLSPGFWKHNLGVYLGEANGSYSDPGVTGVRIAENSLPAGPSPPVTKYNMEAWFDTLALAPYNVNLAQAYADMNTQGGGAAGAATRVGAANIFNYWADLYPY
jgi:hypothetical protein